MSHIKFGEYMPEKDARSRDRRIIDSVVRYRLTLNRILGVSLMQNRSLNAVSKVTARMTAAKLLNRHPLVPPEHYFTLGPRAASDLGLPLRLCEPLGPQALPTDFAVMMFAHQAETRRRKLTDGELSECVPWLPDELRKSDYCLTQNGSLCLMRVDLGGSPRHVAKKVQRAVGKRLELPEFAELATANRFEVCVLTTTREKAKAISKQIEHLGGLESVRLHLAVIPRLSFLLLQQR